MSRLARLRGSTLASALLVLELALLALLPNLADDPPKRTPLPGWSDPALFTEARYGRHASQADRHAAFQDHPMALEHFPAGSLMPPPRP